MVLESAAVLLRKIPTATRTTTTSIPILFHYTYTWQHLATLFQNRSLITSIVGLTSYFHLKVNPYYFVESVRAYWIMFVQFSQMHVVSGKNFQFSWKNLWGRKWKKYVYLRAKVKKWMFLYEGKFVYDQSEWANFKNVSSNFEKPALMKHIHMYIPLFNLDILVYRHLEERA